MSDDDKSLEQLETELNQEAIDNTSQDDAASQDHGTGSNADATDSSDTDGGQQLDSKALLEQLESERKERLKVEQERNLLRNKQKEAENQRLKSVDREKLDELQSAYDQLLSEREQREAQEQEEEAISKARSFRDSIIAERSETVQKAAKALIEKSENNLTWRNAESEAEARQQLIDQLDALESVIGSSDNQDQNQNQTRTKVHANNNRDTQEERSDWDKSLEELAAEVGRAPQRD